MTLEVDRNKLENNIEVLSGELYNKSDETRSCER